MTEEKTWVDELVDRIIGIQDSVIPKVPQDIKWEGRNRKGRLIITGNPGTARYFRWDGKRLIEDDSPEGVRNTIQMHLDTLIDIGENTITIREAIAAGLVTIDGDRDIYDREEMMSLIEETIGNRIKAIFQSG